MIEKFGCRISLPGLREGLFPLVLAAAVSVGAAACGGSVERKAPAGEAKEGTAMAIELTSSAFRDGASIPVKHTCDGEDVSPPLEWSGAPEGTKSLALICNDPDAPMKTWVHWVLYDIPASETQLPEGVPKEESVLEGAKQGTTDFGRIGYGGPCPPPGKPHRYYFKLYALDTVLNLAPGASEKDLLRAMDGHVLAEGQLMGTYKRQGR